jgi:hypothetical protein
MLGSTRRVAVGGVVTLLLLAFAVSAVIPRSSAQVGTKEKLTVVAVLKRDATSPDANKPASTWVLVWRLKNEARTSDLGRELDVCVFEFGQRQYCESAFHISGRGTVIVEGPWDPTELVNKLAVTGGTGDFAGVGGFARFEPVQGLGPENVKVTLKLEN